MVRSAGGADFGEVHLEEFKIFPAEIQASLREKESPPVAWGTP